MAAFYKARGHKLLARFTRGRGAILMLHSVSPEPSPQFDPNGGLRVNPDYLDRAIRLVKSEGYDIISLDEVPARLKGPAKAKPFVAFTLDDGYRDNLVHALPVFQRHQAPFCIYVPTGFAHGRADLWWFGLEGAIAAGKPLALAMDGRQRRFECRTLAGKEQAWHEIYWWLRGIDEDEARGAVHRLCAQAGFDDGGLARERLMTLDEIRWIAAGPLCTIGAHTVNHYSLAKLDEKRCREEIVRSKTGLEELLGKPVRHFSYPYGSSSDAGAREFEMARQAGFATAVTTRKGLLFGDHALYLAALPRLSLNGEIQDERLLAVLLGGAPFALLNGFRRVSVS